MGLSRRRGSCWLLLLLLLLKVKVHTWRRTPAQQRLVLCWGREARGRSCILIRLRPQQKTAPPSARSSGDRHVSVLPSPPAARVAGVPARGARHRARRERVCISTAVGGPGIALRNRASAACTGVGKASRGLRRLSGLEREKVVLELLDVHGELPASHARAIGRELDETHPGGVGLDRERRGRGARHKCAAASTRSMVRANEKKREKRGRRRERGRRHALAVD